MVYKKQFYLTGTDAQNAIISAAIDRIKFPFERVSFPMGNCQIGWMDLNPTRTLINKQVDNKSVLSDIVTIEHGGEPLIGRFEGRNYTLGVFYPNSGNIFVDTALVRHPELAQSTVSAEMAHSVDEFLPLTDDQRVKLISLTSAGETTEVHTWWETKSYETEYYTLVGESFMQMFTLAYSDIPFGNTSDFVHTLKPEQVEEFLSIMGIQRINNVEPALYAVYGGSKIYHTFTHYPNTKPHRLTLANIKLLGIRPCKICKPK